MIPVDLGDHRIGIIFTHPRYLVHLVQHLPNQKDKNGATLKVSLLKEATRRSTRCALVEVVEGVDKKGNPILKPGREITHTSIRTHFRDPFNFEEGRKRALKATLVYTLFTREQRGLIWAAYHNRPRPQTVAKVETSRSLLGAIIDLAVEEFNPEVEALTNQGHLHSGILAEAVHQDIQIGSSS